MSTNSITSNSSSNARKGRRKPANGAPEVLSINGQPQEPQQSQEDASQGQQDACQAPDKAVRLAALKDKLQSKIKAAEKSPSQAGPSRKGREAIRPRWSDEAEAAAAAAGVRLPGTFPVRGHGWDAAIELGVSAAFCSSPPKGADPDKEIRAGDVALQAIDMIAADLKVRPISLVELLEQVEVARLLCASEEASQPDWLDYVAITDSQRKVEGMGLQTCLLYQLAKRLGKPVALTCEGKIQTVTLKKKLV